jgi:hypothetical protein
VARCGGSTAAQASRGSRRFRTGRQKDPSDESCEPELELIAGCANCEFVTDAGQGWQLVVINGSEAVAVENNDLGRRSLGLWPL